MQVRNFIISIKSGKVFFKSEEHKHRFNKWLEQFDDNEYRLFIEDVKEKRSDQQNRYYWLYLNVIQEDTGHASEDLHEWAKGKFLTTSIVEIFGDKVRQKKSTTTLTKGQFIEYIINIELETGIPAPDTTAYLGYSYHK